MKKSSTKGGKKGAEGSTLRPVKIHTVSILDLPALISAVMKHPETPSLIYNMLGESLTDLSNEIDYHAPEMIAATLAAHRERESKRKGGVK
jgi:hypothetical protein